MKLTLLVASIWVSSLSVGQDQAPAFDSPLGERILATMNEMRSAYRAQLPDVRERSDSETIQVRPLTINVGMIAGRFVEVPEYRERRALLQQALQEQVDASDVNVFFVQELWYEHDRALLRDWADRNGFVLATDLAQDLDLEWTQVEERGYQYDRESFDRTAHGLEIVFRLPTLTPKRVGFRPFIRSCSGRARLVRSTMEQFAKPNYCWDRDLKFFPIFPPSTVRGSLFVELETEAGRSIELVTSHLTAFYHHYSIRKSQVHRLREGFARSYESDAFVVAGTDMNFSPFVEDALGEEFGDTLDGTRDQIETNATLYPYLFRQLHVDSHRVYDLWPLHSDEPGYTFDRVTNSFAARSPTAKTAGEHRLDYLWVVPSTGARFESAPAQLVFTQPIEGETYLSDHLGVLGDVTIVFD